MELIIALPPSHLVLTVRPVPIILIREALALQLVLIVRPVIIVRRRQVAIRQPVRLETIVQGIMILVRPLALAAITVRLRD